MTVKLFHNVPIWFECLPHQTEMGPSRWPSLQAGSLIKDP